MGKSGTTRKEKFPLLKVFLYFSNKRVSVEEQGKRTERSHTRASLQIFPNLRDSQGRALWYPWFARDAALISVRFYYPPKHLSWTFFSLQNSISKLKIKQSNRKRLYFNRKSETSIWNVNLPEHFACKERFLNTQLISKARHSCYPVSELKCAGCKQNSICLQEIALWMKT